MLLISASLAEVRNHPHKERDRAIVHLERIAQIGIAIGFQQSSDRSKN